MKITAEKRRPSAYWLFENNQINQRSGGISRRHSAARHSSNPQGGRCARHIEDDWDLPRPAHRASRILVRMEEDIAFSPQPCPRANFGIIRDTIHFRASICNFAFLTIPGLQLSAISAISSS
jgi:hypothetical protein